MILTKVIDEVPGPRTVRTPSAQEAVAAWSAYGLLCVGALKNYATSGDPIDVWSVPIWQAIGAQLRAQIVNDDVDNVMLSWPWFWCWTIFPSDDIPIQKARISHRPNGMALVMVMLTTPSAQRV
jgi:hypothetical protein